MGRLPESRPGFIAFCPDSVAHGDTATFSNSPTPNLRSRSTDPPLTGYTFKLIAKTSSQLSISTRINWRSSRCFTHLHDALDPRTDKHLGG